jgi:amino acid adenylation domain-containing protein
MKRWLQDAVSARAEARPEATAVVWDRKRLSYGEVESLSNRLGQLLVDTRCSGGDRVGLLMPKGPEAIIGMLGALKAGATYISLDPGEPPARLAAMLASADCRWILAADVDGAVLGNALSRLAIRERPLIGWLGEHDVRDSVPAVFVRGDLEVYPATRPDVPGDPDGLAQILYTSGSTGQPKGVMIPHATILSFLDWATDYFGIDETDRVSQHAPLRFDLSTFDVFGTLSAGAELHLVPPEFNLLPHRLGRFIRDHRLTQWLSVPAVLNLLAKFDVVRADDFPELRRVLFAGEVLPTPVLEYWMRRLPHVSFTNLYGPTETTIASSYYTVPAIPEDLMQPIPIGKPCAGEELLILDDNLEPLGTDEIGDLYIRGAGVTAGYWQDPQRTAEAFVTEPTNPGSKERLYRTGDQARRGADGLTYYCGRRDAQIKSRGYRIEIGEIESALHLQPDLLESAIVAIASAGFEGHLICCAYVPHAEDDVLESEIRVRLADLLPSYMLPMRWLQYETLPRNENGKIDRMALVNAFGAAEENRMERRSQ